ncbi:redoxin domain-containing protein [Spirosoma endbachense]|uniref:Redoxin domain-containing protein n=2 Tax=Spirosoma endbachense TaxID=2666025 RepID=A0A6P1VMB0_9BACT|nr:redoxin domain-containing protein [Spirosoma endbachense]
MLFYKQVILTALIAMYGTFCQAQVGVQKRSIHVNRQIDELTPIINQSTGQHVTLEEYSQLSKADPHAYHLVPDYNEFGQPSSYVLRTATAEEHEMHQFRDRNPAKQPKAGQLIAPFSMTGLDGKNYRSADLRGKVVVLSFWISLDKPFWGDKEASQFTDALKPSQAQEAPVVLGILNSEPPGATLNSLPFMPIPNAYGFHGKYHITSIPTFVVIDKTGKVAANLQGPGAYDKLKEVLATVTK